MYNLRGGKVASVACAARATGKQEADIACAIVPWNKKELSGVGGKSCACPVLSLRFRSV